MKNNMRKAIAKTLVCTTVLASGGMSGVAEFFWGVGSDGLAAVFAPVEMQAKTFSHDEVVHVTIGPRDIVFENTDIGGLWGVAGDMSRFSKTMFSEGWMRYGGSLGERISQGNYISIDGNYMFGDSDITHKYRFGDSEGITYTRHFKNGVAAAGVGIEDITSVTGASSRPVTIDKQGNIISNSHSQELSDYIPTIDDPLDQEVERFVVEGDSWETDRYGYRSKTTGEIIIPAIYVDASVFNEGYAAVEYNKMAYIIKNPLIDSELTDVADAVDYTLTPVYSQALCNQQLTGITSSTATLVSGTLPSGLALLSDGTLYGVPTETGTFEFTVLDDSTYRTYKIIITVATSSSILSNNAYSIITALPTITSNSQNYSMTIDRASSYLDSLYINGVKLTKGVDYEVSGSNDTTITIYISFLSRLPVGDNTLTAIFHVGTATNTGGVSQIFNKVATQDVTSAMPFTDVKTSDWYYETLQYVYKNNIFSGTSDTTFAPNSNMTRAMLVATLYRIEGSPTANSTPFTDVKLSDWYGQAVSWAEANGIVSGTSATTFAPNNLLTREQMAAILDRYCTYKGITLPMTTSETVADINSVSDWAKTSVETTYRAGILNADSSNNFNPKNTTTRADAAYILAKFLLTY